MISKREQERLKRHAKGVGYRILVDWLQAAKQSLAQTARLVEQDNQWLEEEAQRAWIARDNADSEILAKRMVEAMAPALAKERKKMNRAVNRERAKLETAGRKLARAKVAALRARR